MESFSFIPTNQKNIGEVSSKSIYTKDVKIVIWLIVIFFIYILTIGVFYWTVVLREKYKLKQEITNLDSSISSYYPKGDVEQLVFNLNDIIDKNYDPIKVIKSIEEAYLPNSKVRNFIYKKSDKIINISMSVSAVNDLTSQIQKFKSIPEIASVDFSSYNTIKGEYKATFEVMIKLK